MIGYMYAVGVNSKDLSKISGMNEGDIRKLVSKKKMKGKKMAKKIKTMEEHLQAIELMLSGIMLKKEVSVKQVAKIIGVSDKTISKIYPERKKNARKKNK